MKIGCEITIARPNSSDKDPEKTSNPFELAKSFTALSSSLLLNNKSKAMTNRYIPMSLAKKIDNSITNSFSFLL